MLLEPTTPGWRAHPDAATVTLTTDDDVLPVSRIWHTGVAVRGAAPRLTASGAMRLGGVGAPVSGLTGHVERFAADGTEIRFEGLDVRRLDAVTRFLREQIDSGALLAPFVTTAQSETTTDPAEIQTKLFALRRHQVPIRARGQGEAHLGRILAVRGTQLLLDLPRGLVGQWVEVEASSRYFVHRFRVRIVEAAHDAVVALLPTAWEQSRARTERRIPAPRHAVARFEHPDVPGLSVEAPILDLSHTGMGLLTDALSTCIYPELRIPELTIEGLTAQPLRLSGVAKVGAERSGVLGIHLTMRGLADHDQRRWHRIVGDLASPGTRLGATWSEMSWDLFRRARYFEISGRSEAHFVKLKRPFADVHRKLDSHPELGCQVVHTSARGLEGSISLLRLYSQSIFGFQIARRQDDAPGFPSKYDVLREMTLRAYEQTRVFDDIRWQIGYVPAEASWSRFVHCEYPARFAAEGLAHVLPFHAWELDCTMPLLTMSRGLAIAEATDSEVEQLLTHVAKTHHPSYCASLDLMPDRFRLEPLVPLWAHAGMERLRFTLAARQRGRAVAVAVIELAQPGLQLFGLLDSIRLYALRPDGRAAFGSLVEAARTWCLGMGRKRMAFLQEGPAFDETRQMQDLGPAELSIMSVDLLPNILEFVWETMAPREPRT